MEGPNAVLNTITLPPGATDTQPRLVLDGVRGAIFLYQSGGPTGALIGSWAISAGTDPYSNAYPQGLDIKVGQIVGTSFIAENAFGATIIYLDPAKDALFIYADTGSATQGALLFSIAGEVGTDPLNGTPYKIGGSAYITISGTTYAVDLNTSGGPLGNPGLSVFDIHNVPNQMPGVFGEGSSAALTPQAFMVLYSGATTASDVPSYIEAASQVQSGVTNGLVNVTAGQFGINSVPAQLSANSSQWEVVNPNDSNPYVVGHDVVTQGAGQTISSTSPAVITGMSFNVQPGPTYRVSGVSNVSANQAGGNVQYGWDGGAVLTGINGYGIWFNQTAAALNIQPYNGSQPLSISHAFAASGDESVWTTDFWFTVTSGGTLNLRAQLGTAGDTCVVKNTYLRLEIID